MVLKNDFVTEVDDIPAAWGNAVATQLNGLPSGYLAVSASFTITDEQQVIDATGTITVTLPSADPAGRHIVVKNSGVGTVTVAGTVDGGTDAILSTQYASITVVSTGTEWVIV